MLKLKINDIQLQPPLNISIGQKIIIYMNGKQF